MSMCDIQFYALEMKISKLFRNIEIDILGSNGSNKIQTQTRLVKIEIYLSIASHLKVQIK